jgi:uncharacterized protein YcbK (DUF882 family)
VQPPAPASRRRALLGLAAAPLLLGRAAPTAFAAQGLAAPVPIPAARPGTAGGRGERAISLRHRSTGESVRVVYHADGRYLAEALRAVDRLLRDWRADRARPTDPDLLDLLWALRRRLDAEDRPLEVVCAYRTPETNAMLRGRGGGGSGGGVARDSLHLRAMAVDLAVPGRSLEEVRAAAAGLRRGGVGYYPRSGFVHLDTGPVRRW